MTSSLKKALVINICEPKIHASRSSDPYAAARIQAKHLDVTMVSIPEIPKENDFFALSSPFDQKRFICLGKIEAPEGFDAVLISQKRKA
jgi:hypothetical protein